VPNDTGEGISSLRTASEIVKAALDRELERDAPTGSTVDETAAPPQADHVEELLATIVGGVVGVAHVQRMVGFSALGGNSLMATRVLSRVWRAFGVKLPLSALIPDGSVASLATAVRRLRDVDREFEPPLRRQGDHGSVDASPNQAAVWLAESLSDVSSLYNIPYGVRIEGPLDVDLLSTSLSRLLRRHEAFQLRFEVSAGRLVQELVSPARVDSLRVVDITGTPSAMREAEAIGLANRCIRASFNLSEPPLVRSLLIKLDPEDHMLVLAIHHIVCDAWSIKVMMRQLSEYYSGTACKHEKSPALGFLDFLIWQRDMLRRNETERLIVGWREALEDAPDTPGRLGDRPRSGQCSRRGAVEPIELSEDLVTRLRDLSADQAASLYMTLLAAFAVVLSRHVESDYVTIGSPIANRQHESFDDVVGYIANMLPMHIDCGGDPTLRELLVRVRTVALAAFDRQALPFAQLVGELEPARSPGVNPLFQAALVVNDLSPQPLARTKVSEVPLHTGTAKLDLTCYLEERESCLSGYLEYATDLFCPTTITCLRIAFERTLDAMLAYVDQPLSNVSLKLP
jgi:hypothetical protein